ncbi:MAG: hypothetical protein IPN04_07115 [Rhodoferax sp.]|nr:hypothetical protein [Rhodoferax sp.]
MQSGFTDIGVVLACWRDGLSLCLFASRLIDLREQTKYQENFYRLTLLLIVSWIASQFYNDRIPEIFTLVKTGQVGKIAGLIHEYGKYNIEGGNRYAANWNALYAICVISALPVLFLISTIKPF